MAKMTRNNLKSLVKECLFEILLEASGDGAEKLLEAKKVTNKKTVRRGRPALDNIRMGGQKPAKVSKKPVDVSSITADPVMAAIFQDTAATTLVEQAAAERGKPQKAADAAAHIVANNDPSDLFGESSKNWAALAFDD
tara:strand:+ start:2307 stop:2720 length:414 start_codon:yes stop_codon:yes gene_type:complete